MLADVSQVFKDSMPCEHELVLEDKRILKITMHPYSYNDIQQSRGVAITFSDVTKVIYTEQGMSVAFNELRNSVNNVLDTLDTEPMQDEVNILVVDDSEADRIVIEKSAWRN